MIATTTEPVNGLDKRPVDQHVALYIHNTSTLACISQEWGKVSADRLKLASGERSRVHSRDFVFVFDDVSHRTKYRLLVCLGPTL